MFEFQATLQTHLCTPFLPARDGHRRPPVGGFAILAFLLTLEPCCEERQGAFTFITACWLDSRKNETGSGSRTTPNTVGLALHFSVGIADCPEFLRESEDWSGWRAAPRPGQFAVASQRVTKVDLTEYHAAVSYLRGLRSSLWRGERTTITIVGMR